MTMTLKEIRANYPDYDNVSDTELADALHAKYYPNMPKEAVYERLGIGMESEIPQTPFNETGQPEQQDSSAYSKYIKPILDYEAGVGLGIGQGLAGSLASMANLFPQAYEKLTGQKVGRVPHLDLMQYAPESKVARIGGAIGEPVGSILAPGGAVAKGTSMAIKAAPLLKKMPDLLRVALSAGAAGGAISEGDRKTGAAIGAGLGVAPSIYQGVKKGVQSVYKPISEHRMAEKAKDSIEKELFKAEGDITSAKDNAASSLNKMLMTNEQKLAKAEEGINKHLPQISEKEAKKTISDYFQNKKTELKESFKKRYGDFKTTAGKKQIIEPYEQGEIDKIIGKADKGASALGKEISPGKYKSDIINAETGKPYVFETPPKKAPVQDHIEFGRQLRDARADLKSGLSDATTAERLSMFEKIDKLKELEKLNKNKIKGSLDPKEWESFEKIQKDYGDLYIPTRQINSVKRILNKNEVKGDILDDLNQPAYKEFYEHLSKDKEFNNAITKWKTRGDKHPMSGDTLSSKSTALSKKLKEWDSLYNHLTPAQKKHMGDFKEFSTKMEALKKTLGKVKSPEFDRRLKQADVKNLLSGIGKNESKEVETVLNKISKNQIEANELKTKAKELGFKVKELKDAAAKRERLLGRAATGLVSSGLTIAGLKTLK